MSLRLATHLCSSSTTHCGHPIRAFFNNIPNFLADWQNNLWGIWVIFGRTVITNFVNILKEYLSGFWVQILANFGDKHHSSVIRELSHPPWKSTHLHTDGDYIHSLHTSTFIHGIYRAQTNMHTVRSEQFK